MLRQLQPAAAATPPPLLLSPALVTAHRIDCHCHCHCPCSTPCCSRIASSLAYYYVNSFHLFPFRAAFFFSPFFFLCLSRWKHVRKHLNQLCPKRHSQRGRAAASAIVMQNASTRPNQAANVLKLTQHIPSPLPLFPPHATANNFGQHARQSSQKRNGSRQFDYRANQASPKFMQKIAKR